MNDAVVHMYEEGEVSVMAAGVLCRALVVEESSAGCLKEDGGVWNIQLIHSKRNILMREKMTWGFLL